MKSDMDALMARVRQLVDGVPKSSIHPGLRLDKYITPCPKQEQQKEAMLQMGLTEQFAGNGVLAQMLQRRNAVLRGLEAANWNRTTAGPLTLHLARTSSLENAGICLHPTYGFVYLPGTGLKGMARAWAETIWKPAQASKEAAQKQIDAVFGWARSKKRKDECSGCVVFHDAWPTRWPRLSLDIANPHHPGYYQGKDDPGDWESPVPVSFLAISEGVEFQFAISARGGRTETALLELAREWLDGALSHLGAGAKTAAGYGRFRDGAPFQTPARVREEHTLTLTTPGFFAGADQKDASGCKLRGATLRGLLRWWWRTLHAGFLTRDQMLSLEKAIWGGMGKKEGEEASSAVSLSLIATSGTSPQRFDREMIKRARGIPFELNKKVTPGLNYLSYGMDDSGRQRYYLPAGATWKLVMTARPSRCATLSLTSEKVMEQATSALWLLCQFGGLGSKSRKGFGCLALDGDASQPLSASQVQERLAVIRSQAAGLRKSIGFSGGFQVQQAVPGSLELMLPPVELDLGQSDPFIAIHLLGGSVQKFTHSLDRKQRPVLGLPRTNSPVKGRHPSPIHYHLFQRGGRYAVRITALPVRSLGNLNETNSILKEMLNYLKTDLPQRVAGFKPARLNAAPQRFSGPKHVNVPGAPVDKTEDGELLPEKTNNGGWKVRGLSSELAGPIINTGDVPADAQPGTVVKVRLVSDNRKNPSFRYLKP